jgi:hypothetical protein
MITLDDLPEDDLLNQEPPSTDQTLARVEFFARCLAYGAEINLWSPRIRVEVERDVELWQNLENELYRDNLLTYLRLRWAKEKPRASFLETFDYLRRVDKQSYYIDYYITPKAFELLNQPFGQKVFLSYRRSTSSAFALLLHDRLENLRFDVFVDLQNIEPAEEWWKKIDAEILLSDVFVSLIAPGTLDSRPVRNELQFALENNILAIPIWNNGYSYSGGQDPDFDKFLGETNAIRVENENVLQYENTIAPLIQFLQTGNPR